MKQLEMDLLDNAYDFMNESLRAARSAEQRARAWKFAIVHIVQAIELLLKERLRLGHPVLIYENVDKQKNTVSLGLAMTRITDALGIQLTEKEVTSIEKARRWRDLMIHYEFELPVAEAKAIYSRLFEFATAFHAEHLGSDLHGHVEEELWPKEAELMAFFRREFIPYHGTEVHQSIPKEIIEAQKITHYTIDGEQFERVAYGSERPDFKATICHDCSVVDAQLHLVGCDVEVCPKCRDQALSCACMYAEYPDKVPLFAT
jgi:hypothetical protein